MCIIGYYDLKKGAKLTYARVQAMHDNNPDGIGYAYSDGKQLYFKKGLKPLEAWTDFLRIKDKALYFVLHARIGTSGGKGASKCHPFPISNNPEKLNATTGKTTAPIVFHNGVFSIEHDSNRESDTQAFCAKVLYPLNKADARGLYNGIYNDLLTLATHGSRVIICYPDRVLRFGSWAYETADKAFYSNTYGYLDDSERTPIYTAYGSYYGRKWWYDDDDTDSRIYYGGCKK